MFTKAAGNAVFAVVLAGAASSLHAKDKDTPSPPPPIFQSVLDCEAIAESTARLSCFDRTVAAMKAASTQGELAVFDRGTMREARRGIFGLGLPKLKLFSGRESEEVRSIDSTITGLRRANDGMPIFVLEDGSRWKQTEGRNVFAKAGDPIHVRQAALGSYMANVKKQPGVRVIRIAD